MTEYLLKKLSVITPEEEAIINGKGLDMSRYSDSSPYVVDSKKLIESGKLFSIRPNTRFIAFPEHRHNYIELIYMCSGTQTHIINGDITVTLKKGELLLLNQNSLHSTKIAGMNDIAINFVILPEFFNTAVEMIGEDNIISRFLFSGLTGKGHEIDYMHFNVSDVLPVQNLLENLIWSVVEQQPNRRNINQITIGLLFLQLLGLSERLVTEKAGSLTDTLVMTALTEIEQNYPKASLKEVAEKCNVSSAYVSSTVKKVTGKTFKEHLTEKRLTKAASLLTSTTLSVDTVIFMVGYENTSYFYRIFNSRFHMSPKEYRTYSKNRSSKNSN